ncbi:MAG: LysM peptidoglycan-binding domain-containing protein [Chloroflexi bacterium]|nr:LysM peptidoglycan-binding domain-containing protein [Chloroflexota bacterium]
MLFNRSRIFVIAFAALFILVACNAPQPSADPADPPPPAITRVAVVTTATPAVTPTPFSTTIIERYVVRNGDTLGGISLRYNIAVEDLMRLNNLTDPNSLKIGQVLKIKLDVPRLAPSEKLLPDSEVVYSPAYAGFDVAATANQYGGYLAAYREKVEGDVLTGAQIIQLVAERYSVGPRVLLALLEFQSGWVTGSSPTQQQITYPMGHVDAIRQGLFFQASWAANHLNEGYYGVISGRLAAYRFKDRSRARLVPTLNPGTIAVQNLFALDSSWEQFQPQIGPDGFIATYRKLFGDPFARAIEPLVPPDLKQPTWRLPWSDGELWYFTGGSHGGWGDQSAWAAIDFAPRDTANSCIASRMWAVSAAPGKVVRVEKGRVMISLSNNDFQGVGWTLLYLHIATNGRVTAGATVNAGDRIGHPSCEGGDSEASHVHMARLYNGQWIGVDAMPFVLSGWKAIAGAQEYEGTMTRGNETREACNCRDDPKNGIIADGNK